MILAIAMESILCPQTVWCKVHFAIMVLSRKSVLWLLDLLVSGVKEEEMYAGCRFRGWIWSGEGVGFVGEGVGFSGEACPGPKKEIGEVKLLRATMGRELAVEEANLEMVGRA